VEYTGLRVMRPPAKGQIRVLSGVRTVALSLVSQDRVSHWSRRLRRRPIISLACVCVFSAVDQRLAGPRLAAQSRACDHPIVIRVSFGCLDRMYRFLSSIVTIGREPLHCSCHLTIRHHSRHGSISSASTAHRMCPIASTLCTGFFGVERLSEPSPLSVTVRYGRYTSIARLS
jgi:hypothetical protein